MKITCRLAIVATVLLFLSTPGTGAPRKGTKPGTEQGAPVGTQQGSIFEEPGLKTKINEATAQYLAADPHSAALVMGVVKGNQDGMATYEPAKALAATYLRLRRRSSGWRRSPRR